MFGQLKLSDTTVAKVDWKMTPDLAFVTFVSQGLHEQARNDAGRVCYFFIDTWGREPKLCLMERGVKYARVLAEAKAPPELLYSCIRNQGGSPVSRENYAIDNAIKEWLCDNVLAVEDSPLLVLLDDGVAEEDMGDPLPEPGEIVLPVEKVVLPDTPAVIVDNEISGLIRQWSFYDAELNPEGEFINYFVETGDGLTVVDECTNLMWQRAGLELSSLRTMKKAVEQLNHKGFAGFSDWRMPTLAEAMSLMKSGLNCKGVHLHPCFSKEQPFIFTSSRRKPGGYWFVDFKQGRTYWSSGTVPGGFARLCRSVL
jgi:hypothetical protein